MKIMKHSLRYLRASVLFLMTVSAVTSKAQIISTVAGTGTAGHTGDGSAATSATLNYPAGIAFDGSGNMYIAEFSGNYIRKVTTAGVISTIAGTGSAGSTGDGSAATSATLNNPSGLAVDGSGNLYIAEASGNRIRKINTSGIISTIAGTGTASSTGDGSAATSATLNFPTDLVFDASGNLYISENTGNRIRKINTSGTISTIAGTGTASSTGDGSAATSATLNNPAGLAFDASGNLYIAENGGYVVRMINTSGTISRIAGTAGTATSTGDGSAATSATLKYPRGLAIDASGNIYISEENGARVRKINSGGTISAFAATGTYSYSGDGSAALSATMRTPFGMAVNAGNLFIADLNSYVIRKVCNAPIPTVTTPVTYCQGVTSTALTATGTNLLWYTAATGGTGTATAPIPSTATVGSTTWYVTQTPTTFGCESPRTSITVTVNTTPAAPTVTTPVTYCSGVTASALTATKVTSSDTLYWYTVATGGTGTKTTGPTPSTTAAGTTPYYVSERSTLGCEGPRATINVVVNATPAAPTVTTPITYCSGVTAASLTATLINATDTLFWYTAATGGTGTKTAIIPSTATPGTTSYYVSEKSTLGCEGPRAAISVVVNTTPSAPIVTSPVNYCQGVTPSALTATLFSGSDTLYWYTVATGGTGATAAPTPSTSTVGTVSYYVSERSPLSCEGPRATINVSTKAIPAAPTVTSTVNYCLGASTSALTATKATPSDTLYWYNSAIGGTGTITAPTPSSASLGSTIYYVSARSSFRCEGPRAVITVNINAIPSAPTATTTINYCVGASTATALTATAAASTDTLYWYTVATGGTGTTVAPTPTTGTVGTTTYYVGERSPFGCDGPRTAIAVNIRALATAPTVVTPVNYCLNASATALTATKASSTDTLYWYTVATGGTGTTTAPTPSTTPTGSTIYYVSGKSSFGCEGSRSALTVTVNPLPTAPTAVSPINYCKSATSVALVATKGSASDTLYWYTVATGGTGVTAAPTPSTATVGSTNYYVSSRNTFGCDGSRTVVTVNVNAIPSAPTATATINYCIGATPAALTATAAAATDTLYWYTVATGGTGVTTAPTPTTGAVGTTTYYVSERSPFSCDGPRTAIAVVINPLATAPTVVSPVNYCQSGSAVALTATPAAATDTLYWYTVATGGTGSTTAITPSTATAGSTTYYVSGKSSFGCEGSRSGITVNVSPSAAAPTVTSPLTYCQGVTAPALTATKGSASDTLYWYTVATGGTGTTIAPIPSTATVGSTNYYVSAKSSFGCEGSRTLIIVNITAAPAAPTVTTPVNYCVGATATALTATGSNLLWYTVATGGTGAASAPVPVTSTAGTINYYVTQTLTVGGCESPRALIAVVSNAIPAAPTVTTPINLCVGATASALTATKGATDTLYWYTVATGGTGSLTAPVPSTASAGFAVNYVSLKTVFGCEGPRSAITDTVRALPAKPTVTTPVTYCQNVTASALTATGSNLKWYTVPSGGTSSSTVTPSTTTAGTTTYYVSQSLASSLGGCESVRDSIKVNVNPAPATPTVTTPVNLCVGGPSSALTATGTSLLWYTASTGGTGSATAPTPTTTAAGTTNYYVTQTSAVAAGSCESPRTVIAVIVNALPAAPTVTTPVNLCVGGPGTTLTATGSNLLWYTVSTGGTGSATAPTATTGTVGTTNYYVSQSLAASSGGCEGSRATIAVVVNALPAAPTVTTPVNLCIGSTATALTATGTNLLWYAASTGGTGSSTAPTPSTSSISTTNYYVSQTSAASSGSCEGSRATIVVNIKPLPVVAISSLSPSGYIFCPGNTITLKATSTSTLTAYQWYVLGTAVSGATSSTFATGGTEASGRRKVTVTDNFGCKGSDSVYVQSDTTPNPILDPTLLYICKGNSGLLTCHPDFTTFRFKWYRNGVDIGALATANIQSVSDTGNYVVVVTNSFGCLQTTNTARVNYYPILPNPVIIRHDPTLSVTGFYTSFQWYLNGTKIIGAINTNHTAAVNGKYYVEVSDANGCVYHSDTVLMQGVSIKETAQNNNIKIYPNPSQGKVTIESPIQVLTTVTDMTGRILLQNEKEKEIDLSNYADGMYFFRITDTNGTLLGVEKINKQSAH